MCQQVSKMWLALSLYRLLVLMLLPVLLQSPPTPAVVLAMVQVGVAVAVVGPPAFLLRRHAKRCRLPRAGRKPQGVARPTTCRPVL